MTAPEGTPDGGADDRLACGRSRDDLLEQVFSGRGDDLDAHQAGCPFCRAELERVEGLWAPHLRAGRRSEEPPPSLLPAVLGAVRRTAGQGWEVEVTGARGTTRISSAVVAALAEHAAGGVPEVRTAAVRPVLEEGGDGAAGDAERLPRLTVHTAVVVEHGVSVVVTGEAVRAAVRAELVALTPVAAPVVDVHVVDVADPDPEG